MKTEVQVKLTTHSEVDQNQKSSSKSSEMNYEVDQKDLAAANYLDIAVLRCLFVSNWKEDGIYWGLHYMYNRLREIGDEAKITSLTRKNRSNSLPIPQIAISKASKNKAESTSSTNSSEFSSEHQSSLHATGENF